MIEIKRLSAQTVNSTEVRLLLLQQSPGDTREISATELEGVLSNPQFYLFVATLSDESDSNYIGMASIFFQRNLARWIAEIHDVVVDENHRGLGTGEQLIRQILKTAQQFSIDRQVKIKLFLTCRPSRTAANALYQKVGFTLVSKSAGEWGTNLYKIIVEPQGIRGLS